jgi:putative DNA methylase
MARKPVVKRSDVEEAVARALKAGVKMSLPTVDFGDPKRPRTCLEVDFPILPVNQVAAIEGNSGKPIYQMSKWWARRRSSVFRSMLIAAATRAPEDPALAAKMVWDAYYGNHQARGSFAHLKVADIFMGGGTTVVEAARLGMQVFGVDLNPVAWLVVKNELADVTKAEVDALLTEVEAEVRPQISPYYAIDCPRGHRGRWRRADGSALPEGAIPLKLGVEERRGLKYEGAEIIYVFWAKHGPCQTVGCGHRTPLFSNPVMAVKTLTVKTWPAHRCPSCRKQYDVEERAARMAPGVPLVVAESEKKFAVLDPKEGVRCPHCQEVEAVPGLGKGARKKVDLSLLVHPSWLKGQGPRDQSGRVVGGSATDDPQSTASWLEARAESCRLLEVRGELPPEVTCPQTRRKVRTDAAGGSIPKKSTFACGECGRAQDVLTAIKATGKTGPTAPYAVQGHCPECDEQGQPYGGRFFAPVNAPGPFTASLHEWDRRKEGDLAEFWPRSEVPYGFMTGMANGDIRTGHGFTHWWTMFNPRQLLVHAQLLRSIEHSGSHSTGVRDFVLGAFQQYLRNQCMFAFWNPQRDSLEPMFANNNYHPKSTLIENGIFGALGRGNWLSCTEGLPESIDWQMEPWDLASVAGLQDSRFKSSGEIQGKSVKVRCEDPPQVMHASVVAGSATDLAQTPAAAFDLVITDPPFGGLLHYAELADFFYVWLRLVLRNRYAEAFGPEYTPKTLEVVANSARHPEDPDAVYRELLTQCWREAHRILKPGGLLAFTFHHSEDAPWIDVLVSLFDAGFYLEATYPIRSDETKGEGEFGAKKVEYDIIHVCRKREAAPTTMSWGRMRREIRDEVERLQSLLSNHAKAGLPLADLQLIKCGKALEFYSRHYGQVMLGPGRPLEVKEAVMGILQVIDEEQLKPQELAPSGAEPLTRQLLRIFNGTLEIPRDQLQKYLRGTGIPPGELASRGWCREEKRVFRLVAPSEFTEEWVGRHRRNLTGDYEQAMFLIGACYEDSGLNAADTLKNPNFQPHVALLDLLDWHAKRGATSEMRQAATRARTLYSSWQRSHRDQGKQLELLGA